MAPVFRETHHLAVLERFLIFSLARGVPGEGPDCHFPKEIIGFGPIPARILKMLIFILALSTARCMDGGIIVF